MILLSSFCKCDEKNTTHTILDRNFLHLLCILQICYILNIIYFTLCNTCCLISGLNNFKISKVFLKNLLNQYQYHYFIMEYAIFLKIAVNSAKSQNDSIIILWIYMNARIFHKCWKLLHYSFELIIKNKFAKKKKMNVTLL